ETDLVGFAELGWVAAHLGGAQAALGTDLAPDFRVRLDIEIREAAIGGFFRPIEYALQFRGFRGAEEVTSLLPGFLQAARAEVIGAPLEHGEAELDREDALEHGQVLFGELLLAIDRVGGDDRFFF